MEHAASLTVTDLLETSASTYADKNVVVTAAGASPMITIGGNWQLAHSSDFVPEQPTVVLNGTAAVQQLTTNGASFNDLTIEGASVELLDNLTTAGDLTVTNGTASTFTALGGKTITVGGNASLTGQSGNLLNLNPSSTWTIDVSGQLTADYATIGNSHAAGSQGQAALSCIDDGGNTNWVFAGMVADAYYWHGATSDFNAPGNWTLNQDGTGPNPPPALGDGFNDGTLNPGWTFIDATATQDAAAPLETGGTLQLAAAGTELWDIDNEFAAVYRTNITGDFDIAVKVVSMTNTHDWAKAGIIFANDIDNLAQGGYGLVGASPGQYGAFLNYDLTGDGTLDHSRHSGTVDFSDLWVRVTKQGDQLRAWYRESEVDAWTEIDSQRGVPSLAANQEIGLFVFSHVAGQPCAAVFDAFTVNGACEGLPGSFTCRFDGTGTDADNNCTMSASHTATAIEFTGYTGTFDIGGQILSVTGDVTIAAGMSFAQSAGSLAFKANEGAQTLTTADGPMLPTIVHAGASELHLAGANLSAQGFSQTAGSVYLDGYDITTSGDFEIAAQGGAAVNGLAGRTITVGGNATLSGQDGNLLDLAEANPWTIAVTGDFAVDYATVGYSNATGSTGRATATCVDAGANINWTFGPVPSELATYYWHGGTSDFNDANNWTSGQDGTGTHPRTGAGDNFEDNSLHSAWTFIDSTMTRDATAPVEANGTLTLAGRGAELYFDDNEFSGVYRTDVVGDFDVSVRIRSMTPTHDWAKAGIIFANDLGNLAAGGYGIVGASPAGYSAFLNYDLTGDGTLDHSRTAATDLGQLDFTDLWVRIVKQGTLLRAYARESTTDPWTEIDQQRDVPSLAARQQIGLFVFSHDRNQTCTAVFDDFTVTAAGYRIAHGFACRFDGTGTGSDADATMSADYDATDLALTGYTGTFGMAGHTLRLSGNADMGATAQLNVAGGTLEFAAATGTQTFTPLAGTTNPRIVHTGVSTLELTAPLEAAGLAQRAGALNLNGHNVNLTGDLDILSGGAATLLNLGGVAFSVVGNVNLQGQPGNLLNLDPVSGWTVSASGIVAADYARIGNADCPAAYASATCTDAGGNGTGWDFEHLTGEIARHTWTGIAGTTVADLTASPDYPDNPSAENMLTAFDAPVNAADDYGTRIRGYVVPPLTGYYAFWISSADAAELYVSSSSDPAAAQKVAWNEDPADHLAWHAHHDQRAAPILLQAGNRYYVEVLHKAGVGDDHVAVGWRGPGMGGYSEMAIPGHRLEPIDADLPWDLHAIMYEAGTAGTDGEELLRTGFYNAGSIEIVGDVRVYGAAQ